MSFVGKRKRYSKDMKCVFFPDDAKNSIKKVGGEPSVSSASSVTKSWEKCGDSFLDTPLIKKVSALRPLALSTPGRSAAGRCDDDPVHIAWSSSESELSDGEVRLRPPPLPGPVTREPGVGGPRRPARPGAPLCRSYSRALRMLHTGTDEQPTIDYWDSEQSESEGEVDKEESLGEISDCQSEPREEPEDASRPAAVTEAEISDYTSDGESVEEDTLTQSRLGGSPPHPGGASGLGSSPPHPGEASGRSVGDWVRSAQAMLQTPRKQTERQSKTPEDSTKKRRKYLSGGLAERLNRLQCRQRSAVSFWRHQSVSDATVATGVKPGVLVLEVLSIQEESGMQLALCERHQTPAADPHRAPPPSSPSSSSTANTRVLALFDKATAALLMPAPGDVVHVYPPWQSLIMEGEDRVVILNTHFSQKVSSDSGRAGGAPAPRAPPPVAKCAPYSLTRSFGLLGMSKASSEEEEERRGHLRQVPTPRPGSEGCDSLLEAVEGWRQAAPVGVEVVVQRVYSVPIQEPSAAALLRPRLPYRSASSAPPPPPPLPPPPLPQKAKSRLCALVQDGYGMFSMVQLRPLPGGEEEEGVLRRYGERWQGRACLLTAVRVVQRVTRERCPRLFNLIDSLWPPVISLKEHGDTHSCENAGRSAGPAPSFCYLLSGPEGSVEPVEGQAVSPLYLPPAQHTLRQILQNEHKSCRCSFVATVVYKRTQSGDVGQSDVWLVVTDPSLQEDETWEGPCRRTVSVCLDTSCVLTSSVATALINPASCLFSFRDAVLEHGVIVCVEQSVVGLTSRPEPVCSTENTARPEPSPQTRAQPPSLPRPLRLDPLGPETTPNSLCTLSGVIVGVDEDTAYSWPVCSLCGSDRLEVVQEMPEVFRCVSCDSTVNRPTLKMQLEVFVSCSPLSDGSVKVKLQQNTIMTILNSAHGGNEFPGYEVENVLGKEVGPVAAYVRIVTRKPALWMGLEEVYL